MKIKKVKKIKNYKSFIDFEWEKFCKRLDSRGKNNPVLKEIEFSKFNVFFGENGSGKTAISSILKSIVNTHTFTKSMPELIEVEIEDDNNTSMCIFKDSKWNGQLDEESIIFFDSDFIDSNVHTHGKRENTLLKHSQNSGKLIIDLDEKANRLKSELKDSKEKDEEFKKNNGKALSLKLNLIDETYFSKYKELDELTLNKSKVEIQDLLKEMGNTKSDLEKLIGKSSQIDLILVIRQILLPPVISELTTYQDLFTREIKEKAHENTDETIKNHFEKHKTFIEYARKEIPDSYKGHNCPLCMQSLSNAERVIEFYRSVFDQSYEIEKKRYLNDVDKLKQELLVYKIFVNNFSNTISSTYNEIEKLSSEFKIEDLYNIQKKETFLKKITSGTHLSKDLDTLVGSLDNLKSLDRKVVVYETLHNYVSKHRATINDLANQFNTGIIQLNVKISEFKEKYKDKSTIETELNRLIESIKRNNEEIAFIDSNKVIIIKGKKILLKESQANLLEWQSKRDELNQYLSETIPKKVLEKMLIILEKFNLSFTLDPVTSGSNTKDYTFAFKIKDLNGIERDLKDGLSEGERQLISLSFFFAYTENVKNKDQKVLVFDDPITSLDSPNLKILADLLHESTNSFGQVIVFTHHPLFQKYIAKPTLTNPEPIKFGVLKNDKKYGGSFIYFDPGYDLIEELKKCNDEINITASSYALQPEGISLKYGQLLRLSVEKFIKNELLMWDREKDFGQITDNLKQSKSKISKLDDSDLETISNIYKYCNYSNLMHADKENPSTLDELKTYINFFLKIIQKSRN